MAGKRSHRHRAVVSEVRALHSPDGDLKAQAPEHPDDFSILVQVLVGPKNEPGQESFDLTVCTPGWLAECLTTGRFVFGRHHLVIDHYDYDLIREAVDQEFAGVAGATWQEVAERLARHGRWEFEDYRPYVDKLA